MTSALGDLLRARGLSRAADALVSQAMEAITIATHRVDEDALVVGASKLGGRPDLPPALPWPEESGSPLAFVAQLRMADVVPYDSEGVLPPHGLLSFFWGSEFEPDDDVRDGTVLYTDDLGSLVRQLTPPRLMEWQHYPACALTFGTKPTLPPEHAASVQALHLTEREHHAYIDLLLGRAEGQSTSERAMPPEHRILGYPYELEPGVVEECYLHGVGCRYEVWAQAINERDRARQAQLTEKARAWRLLLQVASDPEAAMDWEGAGLIYFCIDRADLRERRFENVQATIQFL